MFSLGMTNVRFNLTYSVASSAQVHPNTTAYTASMLSAWEQRSYAAESRADPGSDSDTDVEALLPHTCSQRFFDLLVELKMSGKLSAKTVCVLSYWAKGAGVCEPGSKLAFPPNRTGGHYSAHFDKVVGLDEALKQDWYKINLPGHSKHDVSRTVMEVAAAPAHEVLAKEVSETPGMMKELRRSIDAGEWPDAYTEHPVAQREAPGTVLPLGLHLDGFEFQRKTSAIGFSIINLLTGRRHLLACANKRRLCRCGCKA